MHDFLTVGAAAPLQQAGVTALGLPESYYDHLAIEYALRRDTFLPMLQAAGFDCSRPGGAYYVMAGIQNFGFSDDVRFVQHLIENVGVAAVPGSSFFANGRDGAHLIRFCFCKNQDDARGSRDALATDLTM